MSFDQKHHEIDANQKTLQEAKTAKEEELHARGELLEKGPLAETERIWQNKVDAVQNFCDEKAEILEDDSVLINGLGKVGQLMTMLVVEVRKEESSENLMRTMATRLEDRIKRIIAEGTAEVQKEEASKSTPSVDAQPNYEFGQVRTHDEFKHMTKAMQSREEKKAFLNGLMEGLSEANDQPIQLTEVQERRLEQLQLLQLACSVFGGDLGPDARSTSSKIRNNMGELAKLYSDDPFSTAEDYSAAAGVVSSAQLAIMLDPNAKVEDVVPHSVLRLINRRTSDYQITSEGYINQSSKPELDFSLDPTHSGDIVQMKLDMIVWLRDLGYYDEVRMLCEGELAAEMELAESKVATLRKKEIKEESDKEIDELVEDNIAKWRAGGKDNHTGEDIPPMTEPQIEAYTAKLKEENFTQKLRKEAYNWFFNKDHLSGRQHQMANVYADTFGLKGGGISDAAWDTIKEELIINAPLIIASGGVASLARMAVTQAVKSTVIRLGLAGYRSARAVYRGYKVSRTVRLGASLGGLLTEGAAFELTHSYLAKNLGLTPEWLMELDLPDQINRVFWSSFALGGFHAAGAGVQRAGHAVATARASSQLGAMATRSEVAQLASKITHSGTQKLVQKVLEVNVEMATMLVIGAIQTGIFEGSIDAALDHLLSSEAIFHAYVAVFSLKTVHGVTGAATGTFRDTSGARSTGRMSEAQRALELSLARERAAKEAAKGKEKPTPNPEGAGGVGELGLMEFKPGEQLVTTEGPAEVVRVGGGEVTLRIKNLGGEVTVTQAQATQMVREMLRPHEVLDAAPGEKNPTERQSFSEQRGPSASFGNPEAMAGHKMKSMGYTEVSSPMQTRRPEFDYRAMEADIKASGPPRREGKLTKSSINVRIKSARENIIESYEGMIPAEQAVIIESVLNTARHELVNNPKNSARELIEKCFKEFDGKLSPDLALTVETEILRIHVANQGTRAVSELSQTRAQFRAELTPLQQQLPKKAQDMILNQRIHEYLREQGVLVGETLASVEAVFRSNENITYQGVVDAALPPEVQSRLAKADIQKIKQSIANIIRRREAIIRYTDGQTPAQIAENIFGFKPEGDVKVFRGPFSLFIDFTNPGDYVKAVAGRDVVYTDPGYQMAINSSGCAFPYSPNPKMPELGGSLILGKDSVRNDAELRAFKHEERHQINKEFGMEREGKFAQGRAELKYHEGLGGDLYRARDKVAEASTEHLERAKDEMLSYIIDGTSFQGTVDTLTRRGDRALYDYSLGVREKYEKNWQEFAGLGDVFRDVYLGSSQELYTAQIRVNTHVAYEMYYAARTPAERAAVLNQLSVTPVRHWRTRFGKEWNSAVDQIILKDQHKFNEKVNDFLRDGNPTKLEQLRFELEFYESQFGIDRSEIFGGGRRSVGENIADTAHLNLIMTIQGAEFNIGKFQDNLRMLVGLRLISPKDANLAISRMTDRDMFMTKYGEDYVDMGMITRESAELLFDRMIGDQLTRNSAVVFRNPDPNSLVVGEYVSLQRPDGSVIEGVVMGMNGQSVNIVGRDTSAAASIMPTMELSYDYIVGLKQKGARESKVRTPDNLPELLNARIQRPEKMYELMLEAETGDVLIGEVFHPDGSIMRIGWPVMASTRGSADFVSLQVGQQFGVKAKLRFDQNGAVYMTYKAPNTGAPVEWQLRHLSLKKRG